MHLWINVLKQYLDTEPDLLKDVKLCFLLFKKTSDLHVWWYKEHIVLNLFQLQRMAHGHKKIDTIFSPFYRHNFRKRNALLGI